MWWVIHIPVKETQEVQSVWGGVLVEDSVLEKDPKEEVRSTEPPVRVPRQRRRGRTVLRKELDQPEVQCNAKLQITG